MRGLAFPGGHNNVCSIKMTASPQPVARRRTRQLALEFRTWGGKRAGAGRKLRSARAGVAHRSRGEWTRPMPLHVTLRMAPHVYNLRSRRSFRVIAAALRVGGDRFDVRVIQFSVQGNHIHLLRRGAQPPRARPCNPGLPDPGRQGAQPDDGALRPRVRRSLSRARAAHAHRGPPRHPLRAEQRRRHAASVARPTHPATSIRTRPRARRPGVAAGPDLAPTRGCARLLGPAAGTGA